jgi:rubrerythrin
MKKEPTIDPFDALSEAFETMYEHVANNLHKLKDKTAPLVHDLVDEAREKVEQIEEVTEEDAEKLAKWLKRDLDDAATFVSETEYAFKDWIGFEASMVKSTFIDMMLDVADKTTVELLRMKDNSTKPYEYHTGEITGFGTLICDECGEKLHFHKAGKIPPCPKCHQTKFHRIQIR